MPPPQPATGPKATPGVDAFVEAYERALAGDGAADLPGFAPPADHPDRLSILCELVRVDLEHRRGRGQARPLEAYRDAFPDVFGHPGHLRAMIFEEYRLRLQAGERPTREEYRDRFGAEFAADLPPPDGPDRAPAAGMERAATAYRAYRREGGGPPETLDSMLRAHGVLPDQAEFLRDLDRTDPHGAERLAEALGSLPRVGGRFLGFRLRRELGRGAFGRVFLANQGDLADRLVALKVSADVTGETNALAQLQHTNVVPIYSVHRRGPLQAVCMPYLGANTLADALETLGAQGRLPRSGEALLSTLLRRGSDGTGPPAGPGRTEAEIEAVAVAAPHATPQVERLRGLAYVPAVLWLIARVADGLAHAHERGVLHRDLKPANILFADDGEPLLLDFNLAADVKGHARASAALVGGTLPYMPPEALAAFRDNTPTFDARGDVYALGVVLYEFLTGAPPFPARTGPVDDVLPAMIADRRAGAPDVRALNPSASPAVASIVRRCLDPDPDCRYPSARAFQEDLEDQIAHRRLRHAADPSARERVAKWGRRHPRLTSSTTVAAAAAVLLVGVSSLFVARQRRFAAVEAAESFRAFGGDRREAVALLVDPDARPEQVRQGFDACEKAVGRYRVLDDPSWPSRPPAAALPPGDRGRLRDGLGEVLVYWARALARRGDTADAADRLARAEACFAPGPVPRAFVLAQAELAGRAGRDDGEVKRLVARAEAIPLRTPRERLLGMADRIDAGSRRKLLEFLDATSGEDPGDFANWAILANWYARVGRVESALPCYDVAVAMAPKLDWPRFNRGLVRLDTKEYSQALEDFDAVLALRPDLPTAYLNRALARLGLGDARGAVDDLTRCLAGDGAPTRAWFIRAEARRQAGDHAAALADRAEGLRRTPADEASWVARGLARLPADPRGALADFDAALALNPRYVHALQDKASVLSETLGKTEEAVAVLDEAVRAHPSWVPALAGRGVLLARLGRRDAAVRDARAAVALDDRPLTAYQAACVFALTSTREPADRAEAFRLLAAAFRGDASWLAVAPTDGDLAAVRDRAEFRKLLDAFAVIRDPSGPH